MKLQHITPILNVSDVPASLRWFELMGFTRCWTYNDSGPIEGAADSNENGAAAFAAVQAGECEIFLCHNAQGARGTAPQTARGDGDDESGGVWMSLWVETPGEVDGLHALALRNGFTVTWPPTDEPWGCREFRLVHPDGHTFRISAPVTPD